MLERYENKEFPMEKEPVSSENTSKTESPSSSEASEETKEYGGREGPNPVRYGDWENKGKCVDF